MYLGVNHHSISTESENLFVPPFYILSLQKQFNQLLRQSATRTMSANIQSLVFENDTDFEEMMPACWEAFEDPFATFLRIVFYLKGNTPEDRKESIAASAAGLRAFHQMNPNSHWIKAIELDTGKIIGAANWLLYKESPYTGVQREPIVAVWWPEGEGRNYATHYMRQIEAHKPIQYNRPHVCECVFFLEL